MLNEELMQKAVRLLVEAASPRRIILFGSYARGEANEDSDFDFLVIEDRVESHRREMSRLLSVLGRQGIPADLLVMSESDYEEWKDAPGTVYCEVALEGRVVYEAEPAIGHSPEKSR